MSYLIDREEVLDRYEKICVLCGKKKKHNAIMCKACYLDDAIIIVEEMPSAEPERKTGEWIEKEVTTVGKCRVKELQSAKCSVCGKYHNTPYLYYFGHYQYCPSCGAEMTK